MALFKAYEPRAEVDGETILSFVNGLGVFRDSALKLLHAHGIDDPQPGQWYLQQAWLDAFRDLHDTCGKNCLIMVGRAIPRNAKFPEDIDNIEKGTGLHRRRIPYESPQRPDRQLYVHDVGPPAGPHNVQQSLPLRF